MFLFIILEGYCLYLFFSHNHYQKAAFISSSNHFVGNILTTANNAQEYFHLKETNENLSLENALLRSQLKDAYNIVSTKEISVKDTVYKVQYKYITAKIINNSVNRRNNYLTLNIGSDNGIKPEMAVFTSTGIVGITKDVSPHYTSVLSVLNKDARISAKVKKNGYYGSLFWEGGDHRFATLADSPTHVPLKIGDTITTNSYSAIFPDNLMIGTINKISTKPGENFYTLTIKFSANLKNITYVYVINNLLKDEQKELEERSQNDK
jgi:rod shape-determining protein MreC